MKQKQERLLVKTLKSWGDRIERFIPYEYREKPRNAFAYFLAYQNYIKCERYKAKKKKENEKADDMMSKVPKTPADLGKFFTEKVMAHSSYMFYNKKHKTAYCTWCKEDFAINEIEGKIKHNHNGLCPRCKHQVTFKSDGMPRSCIKDLGSGYLLQKVENKLLVRWYWVRQSFEKDYRNPEMSYAEVVRAFFDTKKNGVLTKEYYEMVFNYEGIACHWKKKRIYTDCYGHGYVSLDNYPSDSCAMYITKNALKGTAFEYSQLKEYFTKTKTMPTFYRINEYLENYTKHPYMESLIKIGFLKLAKEILTYPAGWEREITKPYTTEKELHKILGISRNDYKILLELKNPSLDQLKAIKADKHGKQYTLSHYLDILNMVKSRYSDFFRVAKYHSINKLISYLKKTAGEDDIHDITNDYLDYMGWCEKLNFEMDSTIVLYPKDFTKAHDDTCILIKEQESKGALDKISKLLPKMHEMYDFVPKGPFFVTAPKFSKDILREGQLLHHCVGTYLSRVADETCIILFIRKKDCPSKPFYTMEIRDNKIIQCRGKCNCSMTDEIKDFVEKFKKEKKLVA